MLSLLVISSIAAALVPVERDSLDDNTTTTTSAARPTSSELIRRTVEAGGKIEKIRARVGDQLELRVRVRRPGEVAIPKLGQLQAVDPAAPAYFDLLLDEPGAYPVRLVGADRPIARIKARVEKRGKAEQKRGKAERSGKR